MALVLGGVLVICKADSYSKHKLMVVFTLIEVVSTAITLFSILFIAADLGFFE